MRILLINQFYPPDVAATGQLLADLAKTLVQKGHEVHLICSRGSYSGDSKKYPRYRLADGIHIHRVNAFNFGREKITGRIADYLSFYVLALFKAFRLPRPDVCLSLTTPPYIGLIAVLLRRLKGTRFMLWVMDVYPEVAVVYSAIKKGGLTNRLCAKLSRLLYSKASAIISLGEIMTNRLIEAGAKKEKIITVHNWAVCERCHTKQISAQSLRQKWNLNGEVTLMYSGNIGLGHNLKMVFEAAAILQGEKRLQILIIGNGKGRAPLEKLSKELKLNCVKFHDPVPIEELQQMLTIGDVHIVAQKPGTEGLIVPSKLYGILAVGRPVLFMGPQHCEAGRIISKNHCGIVVPPAHCADTTERIRRLLSDTQLRDEMGKRARKFYETQLGYDKSTSRICKAISGQVE